MTEAPAIETARLSLRGPAARDAEALEAFAASARARFVCSDVYVAGLGWRMLAMHMGHWALRGYGLWAVAEKGSDAAIGMVGWFHPGDWPEREIGWSLFEGFEGRGYADEAARAARRWGYETFGWSTAVSYIVEENARSRRLAERLGCAIDADAPRPDHRGRCLVYRHPGPAAAS